MTDKISLNVFFEATLFNFSYIISIWMKTSIRAYLTANGLYSLFRRSFFFIFFRIASRYNQMIISSVSLTGVCAQKRLCITGIIQLP